jgi:hypothetical protein
VASRNRPGDASKPDAAFQLGNDVAEADQPVHIDGLATASPARKTVKIATVSHTLDAEVAERLRHFAFRERISESAVIEYALRELFAQGDNEMLGTRLRESGAALRRKA